MGSIGTLFGVAILCQCNFSRHHLATFATPHPPPPQQRALNRINVVHVSNRQGINTLKTNLTLKAPITTAADDFHLYFFIVFQRK